MTPSLSLVRLAAFLSLGTMSLLRPLPDAVSISVTASSDDAWQASTGGTVDLTATSLPLGDNGTASRTVGLRFAAVAIPPGALITDATLTLQAAFTDPGAASLLIAGHDVGSSGTFTSSDGPADRWAAATASQVEWTPEDWTAGTNYVSPDLTPIVQSLVNRSDWASGNALTLLIADNDGVTAIDRRAVSFNSNPAQAARLDITYQLSPNVITVTTNADVFDAGGLATTLPCWGGAELPASITASIDPALLPGDDGLVSLREALCAANGDPAANVITFNLPGPGPYVLDNFWGNLPGLYDDGTTVDGTSQPGYAGSPLIEIHGPPGNAGVIIEGGASVVRGLAIIGFDYVGIEVRHPSASGAVIEANYLGVDPDGSTPDGLGVGVTVIEGASSVEIRDNVISGNSAGLWIQTNDNLLQGNFIGTDPSGSAALGNANEGVILLGPFGGTSTGNQILDNVISANGSYGIYLGAGANDVVIQGNMIGTDALGTAALGNTRGVDLSYGSTGALVGGPDPAERNIISGNIENGISIRVPGTSGHQVIGNYIGVDASGDAPLGNGGTGVAIEYGATDNLVTQNVISGNGGRGVFIRFLDASGNSITDNSIGVTASGVPLGNAMAGVEIESGANLISGNIIAYNGAAAAADGGSGVRIEGDVGNHVTQNSIYGNIDRGIDLVHYPEGSWYVTPNDPGDGDAGPNDLLNFPELTSLSTALVEGTACDGCTVEVFRADDDPSSHGEGEVFLASGVATGGVFSIDISTASLGTCDPVTTTATDANGNTSEFSANLSPGSGGFACLTFIPEGLFLIGIILLGGALVGGLGFRFGKTLPFAIGGFAIGGLAGAAAFLPLRQPVRRLLNPPPAIIEAVPEPELPTETPIAAIILLTDTAPAPLQKTATATPTATPTATRFAPGPVTATRTQTATPIPDTTGPAIKAVADAPDPIYVTQPKGCSPNASVVSASITDPSGVASAVVIFFHTTIGQVPMTNVGGNNWQATLGPYTGTGDGTVDYQIRATDGEGNMSESGFSQITVLACLP